MAVNTLYFASLEGDPVLGDDEKIIRRYEGIQFEVTSGDGYPGTGGNYYGTGTVYLTKYRLLLIPNRRGALASLTLPLSHLSEIKENRPIFGDRNVQGLVEPVPNRGLYRQSRFKIILKQHTNEFTQDLKDLCDRARHASGEDQKMHSLVSSTGTITPSPPVRQKSLESEAVQGTYVSMNNLSLHESKTAPVSVGTLSSGELIYSGRPVSSAPQSLSVPGSSFPIIPGTPVTLTGPIPVAYPVTESMPLVPSEILPTTQNLNEVPETKSAESKDSVSQEGSSSPTLVDSNLPSSDLTESTTTVSRRRKQTARNDYVLLS